MLYVGLWTQFSTGWLFTDYTYRASSSGGGGAQTQAAMTSPAPGSTLTSSAATFQWSTGSGALAYHLYVGTTAGGNDIYSQNQGTSLSVTGGGLPTNGSTR